jgi:hypothetical protein
VGNISHSVWFYKVHAIFMAAPSFNSPVVREKSDLNETSVEVEIKLLPIIVPKVKVPAPGYKAQPYIPTAMSWGHCEGTLFEARRRCTLS